MSRSHFFPLVAAALFLTACGADDESTEPPEEDVTEEQTEDAEETEASDDTEGPEDAEGARDTDGPAADQSQTEGSEDAAEAPDPEETDSSSEAGDSDVEASVEYVASADGPGQVAAGFGNHDFEDFTDSWTESEEVDSRTLSMSVEADDGTASCEIIVDGESLVEEQDESGSVYCAGVIE